MPPFEPRIPRELATQLGHEAVAISMAGRYLGPLGEVNIAESVLASRQRTVHFGPSHAHPEAIHGSHRTTYEVTNETTLSAHLRHQDKGHNVVSLNFASATSPGGGFLNGARAQEEYLCRSSGLYVTLKDSPMYAYHRAKGHKLYSDAMIYSPEVPVFRDDEHRLLATPYKASFITSAACLTKHLAEPELSLVPEIMFNRMLKVLSVAQAHGHDSLVLGAWGCGAFGNDGNLIALFFDQALNQTFKGAFKEVTFAIVDTSPDLQFLSPFARRFQAAAP